jgi:hypothetical protein
MWGATAVARATVRHPDDNADGAVRFGMWTWLAVSVVAVAAVGALELSRAGSPSSPGVVSAVTSRATNARGDLPAAAVGLVSRSIGHADPAYAARRVSGGGFVAHVRAQGLSARFTASGVQITSGAQGLSLSLADYGRLGSLRPVAPVRPTASVNTISYRHTGLREWYAVGPLGLEQGFLVRSAPSGSAGARLELSLAVHGNVHAALVRGSVVFGGPRAAGFSYRDLVVTDASGRRLPARLVLGRHRVLIRIDDRGARYPLRVDPLIENAKLTDSDGNGGANGFGESVALDADTIVVGAPTVGTPGTPGTRGHPGTPGTAPGAVYVFVRPAQGWSDAVETAKLTDPAASTEEQLGNAVAVQGDTIVASTDAAEALVFTRPAGGWSSSAPVTAHLTDSAGGGANGQGLAIDGDNIVMASPYGTGSGHIAVFTEPAGGWVDATQTATLTATDAPTDLGFSVAMSGDTIVAGSASGAAYVYTEPAGGWTDATQSGELTASNATEASNFGQSVAVAGDTVAVGAYQQATATQSEGGAIYVYSEPAAGWTDATQTAELTNANGGAYDDLGDSVAVSGDTIVGGALQVGDLTDDETGALEVFTEPDGGWTDETNPQVLIPDDPNVIELGRAVAANGGVVVGTSNGANPAAYVWTATQPPAITSAASTTETMHSPFDFQVTTTGSPAPAITETGTLPSGVTFTDNGDGTADLAGTPAVGTAGSYPITISASNGYAPDASQSFMLTISAAKTTPAFNSAAADTVTYGAPLNFTVTTSGYPVPRIRKSGSVPGVTFTDNGDGTATISGTPAGSASGPYTLELTATNSAGTGDQSFTLTVTRPPSLASIKNTTATVGNPASIDVTATKGYPAPSIAESGALPNGVQFTDNGDGSAEFSGTPSDSTGGTYPITVTATNSSGTASQSFVLTVEQSPAFTSAAADSETIGSSFTFAVTATGSPSPKITEAGSLPAGVKWSASSATLSGTPKKGSAGTYQLTFTATNKAATVTQQFTLSVS